MRFIQRKLYVGTTFFLFVVGISISLCITTASGNLGQQAISAVMGESAVVDKETGRIYWEGGSSSTLAESIAPKLRSIIGISHMKASILTVLLFFAIAGTVSQFIHDIIHVNLIEGSGNGSIELHPFIKTSLIAFTHSIVFLPKMPRWFVITIIILYLMEAYMCSTHRYLSHVVTDAEAYIEELCERTPTVEWKIRSFHYENLILSLLQKVFHRSSSQHKNSNTIKDPSFPSLLDWKCVTHTATEYYNYTSCTDRTVAGVWKRASINMDPIVTQQQQSQGQSSVTSTSRIVPITKIILSKTLLLRDTKTRQDYFAQQKSFLRNEHHDEYAEFSTNIYIDGFESRVLAIPSSRNSGFSRWLRHRYTYWILTCFGMTVPYRRWISSTCDEVRVRVVKETSSDKASTSNGKSPSSASATTTSWFSTSALSSTVPMPTVDNTS